MHATSIRVHARTRTWQGARRLQGGGSHHIHQTYLETSHRAHDAMEDDDLDFLTSFPAPRRACLATGDASVYDSRLLHAGGANLSDELRALFYVTFRHPEADAVALGNEDAHSIRPEYVGRFSLGQIRKWQSRSAG